VPKPMRLPIRKQFRHRQHLVSPGRLPLQRTSREDTPAIQGSLILKNISLGDTLGFLDKPRPDVNQADAQKG